MRQFKNLLLWVQFVVILNFLKFLFWRVLFGMGIPKKLMLLMDLRKKMILVQSQAYRKQYNFKSIVAIPTNLYGPNDNFDPSSSHVIPALILKIYNAKKNNSKSITLWGDGTPTRDFFVCRRCS